MEALIATVIGMISPYLVKGAEEFAKTAGAAAFEGTKALVGRLIKWWQKEPVAEAAAKSFKSDPKRYAKVLSDQLAYDLEKDPSLADDLRRLVGDLGPSAQIIQNIEIADGVTGADIEQFVKGQLVVQQTIREGKNVTGAKVKTFGG